MRHNRRATATYVVSEKKLVEASFEPWKTLPETNERPGHLRPLEGALGRLRRARERESKLSEAGRPTLGMEAEAREEKSMEWCRDRELENALNS